MELPRTALHPKSVNRQALTPRWKRDRQSPACVAAYDVLCPWAQPAPRGPVNTRSRVTGKQKASFMIRICHRAYQTRGIRRRRRRGFFSIELIMVLVVLILATFVSMQFGIALIVK